MKFMVNGMSVEVTGEKAKDVRVEDEKIIINGKQIKIELGEGQVQKFVCRGDVFILIQHIHSEE